MDKLSNLPEFYVKNVDQKTLTTILGLKNDSNEKAVDMFLVLKDLFNFIPNYEVKLSKAFPERLRMGKKDLNDPFGILAKVMYEGKLADQLRFTFNFSFGHDLEWKLKDLLATSFDIIIKPYLKQQGLEINYVQYNQFEKYPLTVNCKGQRIIRRVRAFRHDDKRYEILDGFEPVLNFGFDGEDLAVTSQIKNGGDYRLDFLIDAYEMIKPENADGISNPISDVRRVEGHMGYELMAINNFKIASIEYVSLVQQKLEELWHGLKHGKMAELNKAHIAAWACNAADESKNRPESGQEIQKERIEIYNNKLKSYLDRAKIAF